MKSVISGPNTEKYGPEIIPYLDTFHAVPSLLLSPSIITLLLSLQSYSFFVTLH